MGTDSIKLFNKTLADQILAMELDTLARFLNENVGVSKQKDFTLSIVLYGLDEEGTSVPDVLNRLLSEGHDFTELKSELALGFAFGDEEVFLDYWGCYAEVFSEHPEGSISSLDYLSNQEETFLLLRPDHIDRMIRSLYKHIEDLNIMDKKQIEKVEYFRDFCSANQNYLVAYLFDF